MFAGVVGTLLVIAASNVDFFKVVITFEVFTEADDLRCSAKKVFFRMLLLQHRCFLVNFATFSRNLFCRTSVNGFFYLYKQFSL